MPHLNKLVKAIQSFEDASEVKFNQSLKFQRTLLVYQVFEYSKRKDVIF